MRGPQTQNGWTAGEKGRRFLASLDPAVAVRSLVPFRRYVDFV